MDFATFIADIDAGKDWQPVSQLKLGEWLVDLLCLIPIHIAITRENRFIPLKDGVTSSEWEKSLLGADVSRIIDGLSLGWYESIFQSYMASKVRVDYRLRGVKLRLSKACQSRVIHG